MIINIRSHQCCSLPPPMEGAATYRAYSWKKENKGIKGTKDWENTKNHQVRFSFTQMSGLVRDERLTWVGLQNLPSKPLQTSEYEIFPQELSVNVITFIKFIQTPIFGAALIQNFSTFYKYLQPLKITYGY